jgi:hypothetical protein
MLKICTVYFEGFYTPDYVSNLYEGIKKHSDVPFQSVCISDTLVEADIVLPFNKFSNIKKHWHKLKFFSEQFGYQNKDDDIIIMDIDQVIVNNFNDVLNYKVNDGELLTYNAWWDNKLKKNGGFYKFKSGTLNHVWDNFALNPEYWQMHYYNSGVVHKKYYGEQNYVYDKVKNIKTLPGKWLYRGANNFKEKLQLEKTYCSKFNTDHATMGDINKYIKVIHYNGVGKKIDG